MALRRVSLNKIDSNRIIIDGSKFHLQERRKLYTLHIANKKYSSWSLRPWVLMRTLDIAFEEQLHPFNGQDNREKFSTFSPTGKVPCLIAQLAAGETHKQTIVWDSMGITEYLAERHAGVWPQDALARAWARCAAAEMHSGYAALRNSCPMCCGVRVELKPMSEALRADMLRIDALWSEGLSSFGGSFLAGDAFTAVDAFFAPVAFRVQTYGLPLSAVSEAYTQRLLQLPAMKQWYREALQEHWPDARHEEAIRAAGKVLSGLNAER